jgi:hypothetical protein
MTPALSFCVVFGLSLAAAGQQPGAPALFQLQTSVTTRTARAGDPVPLRTASPIVLGGVSIPIGSEARGVVTFSRRPGRMRGGAGLEIEIQSIVRPDGSPVPLTARFSAVLPRRTPLTRDRQVPRVAIIAGMAAGYATAALVSRRTNSEEEIAATGIAVGATTAVLVGLLQRGEDMVLRSGQTIEVWLPSI